MGAEAHALASVMPRNDMLPSGFCARESLLEHKYVEAWRARRHATKDQNRPSTSLEIDVLEIEHGQP